MTKKKKRRKKKNSFAINFLPKCNFLFLDFKLISLIYKLATPKNKPVPKFTPKLILL